MNQYFIHKHGGQHVRSEPIVDYYKYIEPVLLDDDNKSMQDYIIHDNELFHLKVQVRLLFKKSML